MKIAASGLVKAQCFLGEGPLWYDERKSIFWVDIEAGSFYEYDWHSKTVTVRQVPMAVSVVVKSGGNQVILGVEGGLLQYDLASNQYRKLLDIEAGVSHHRSNDGKVDSSGRLWIGTLHRDFIPGSGTLYCVDSNLAFNKRVPGLAISNGMAWSADDQYFFFIDSPTHTVKRFPFDAGNGTLGEAEVVIQMDPAMGSPDGMCIDTEGMLWVAHWGGFCVRRWNPGTGAVLATVQLPVPHVSSCCFAGEYLDQLVITTARQGLTEDQLREYPQSGDVFLAQPGVRGTATPICRL